MTIGDRLSQLRDKYNYTLDFVGERIGTTKQTIYKYETGIITNIPVDKIQALADLYEVSPAYIMGWEDKTTVSVTSAQRRLLDASVGMKPEDLELAIQMIEALKRK